jgi:hypothetical protein
MPKSSASFTLTDLVGDRTLVEGTDARGNTGSTVVSNKEWREIAGTSEYNKATEAFDAAVDEFFKPLVEAAEALEHSVVAPPSDAAAYVVLEEGVEGVAAKDPVIVKLSRDSVILRLIEEGGKSADRLAWINDELEVLAA